MELHPVHIEILNILKSSADGMTRHEIEKRIGKRLAFAYFHTLKKYGYIKVVGEQYGYKQIVYPDGDILNAGEVTFPVYKTTDGKW